MIVNLKTRKYIKYTFCLWKFVYELEEKIQKLKKKLLKWHSISHLIIYLILNNKN